MSASDIPSKRSVSEIWNAAGLADLDSAPVLEYYKAWLTGARTASDRLSDQGAVRLVAEVVRDARHLALATGAGVAASAAERALQAALRETAVGSASLITAEPEAIKIQWEKLSEVSDATLTRVFLQNVIEQLTRFYASRDLPEYLGTAQLPNAAALNERVEELGRAARQVIHDSDIDSIAHGTPRQTWKRALARGWDRLTELGRSGQ